MYGYPYASSMPSKHRTAAQPERSYNEQLYWDHVFCVAYADALRRNHKRSDHARIVWAAARADDALELRRRSQKEQP